MNENISHNHALQLSINVGSSNIKLAIFSRANERLTLIKTEKIERNEAYILRQLKQFIADNVNDINTIKIVSHRFVLLDKSIKSPCVISSEILQQLKSLGSLAPLHNPLSILLVDICYSLFAKNTVQTLHADTDFFKPLPALAAVQILRELTSFKIRFINVVNLMTLQVQDKHPHGLDDKLFNQMFTATTPMIFAFHGYPSLIHKLTYLRFCHSKLHVHGFCEQGTTTTPFDMLVMNKLDRFNLVKNAVSRVKKLKNRENIVSNMDKKLHKHKQYIHRYGEDMPEIRHWQWT